MRRRGGRGTGDESPPDPTKGPSRWKASRIITSRRSSRAGGHGGLGGFLTRANEKASRRRSGSRASGRGRGDRDVRGSVDRGRRGKKTPTLVAAAGQQPAKHEAKVKTQHAIQNVVSSTIRRSESSAVKALGPPVKPSGAQTPGGAHAVKIAAGSRERTRCGCTQFRSGGRSRSDALRVLPTGRSQVLVVKKHGRALARRKLEASLTRGTSGEKAKQCAVEHKR